MAQEIQQLKNSMEQLNQHNQRTANAHDAFKTKTQNVIAQLNISLATAQATANAANASGGRRDPNDFQLIDLKNIKPPTYGGNRDESYKMFNKKFKAFADSRKEGFRDALDWVEKQTEVMDLIAVQSMKWPGAELANKLLYNILVMQCNGEPLVIIENHRNMGFEAWRKLKERFDPIGETSVFDKLTNLMPRERC